MSNHSDLYCSDDCIQCGEHINREDGQTKLAVMLVEASGTVHTLEDWVVCTPCLDKHPHYPQRLRMVRAAID